MLQGLARTVSLEIALEGVSGSAIAMSISAIAASLPRRIGRVRFRWACALPLIVMVLPLAPARFTLNSKLASRKGVGALLQSSLSAELRFVALPARSQGWGLSSVG
jgi:hypothetical protein